MFDTDRVECETKKVFLLHSSAPVYETLSYTWGDTGAECSITVNSRVFQVRKNLVAVLRWPRLLDQARMLWIDTTSSYSDRPRIKYCRNLRSNPLFSEVSDSARSAPQTKEVSYARLNYSHLLIH